MYKDTSMDIWNLNYLFYAGEHKLLPERKRLDEGKKVVPVSCNFSRIHFTKPGFSERFEAVLEKYQIDKELIEVEITETIAVEELLHQLIKNMVVKMTEALNAQVVCEGVETKEDVLLMNEINAYVAQGYYYLKPIPE